MATTPAPSRCWCLVSRWHEAQYRKIWGQAGLIRVSSEALNPRPPVALIVQRVPADVESDRYQLWYLSAHSFSVATSPRIPEGSRKNPPGPCEQPRLSGQVQFLAVPNGSPKDTGLKDALVGDQAGRSSNHASFGRQSEGPGDGSRYQNFLDGILLSGRSVHQITYNFQRPRFALEIVGTS